MCVFLYVYDTYVCKEKEEKGRERKKDREREGERERERESGLRKSACSRRGGARNYPTMRT